MVGAQSPRKLERSAAMLRFMGQNLVTVGWHFIGFALRPIQKHSEKQFAPSDMLCRLVPFLLFFLNHLSRLPQNMYYSRLTPACVDSWGEGGIFWKLAQLYVCTSSVGCVLDRARHVMAMQQDGADRGFAGSRLTGSSWQEGCPERTHNHTQAMRDFQASRPSSDQAGSEVRLRYALRCAAWPGATRLAFRGWT